ncbi:hypothetical protein RFI_24654 [Reticulomyxa filosa]|uniref:Peripheral subunit-binding (PSBD) domain-containing protein n=1 Tax=Reticulomyxa filosa TaxID=46433 RepID=X6MFC7_RETFI|nr:hypothetical protein RFI_24654 [Reticulomyxa filosa]|eukprot:ETO12723.1 hypothetical protein RFI_24654 [Reticulomyxa filosa]
MELFEKGKYTFQKNKKKKRIQTDKSVVAWTSTDEGYLAKQLSPANPEKLPVGTPIAIIVRDASSVAAFKDVDPKSFSPSSSKASSSSSSQVGLFLYFCLLGLSNTLFFVCDCFLTAFLSLRICCIFFVSRKRNCQKISQPHLVTLPHHEIVPPHQIQGMPALSPTAIDGAIAEWLLKEGDQLQEGTEIALVSLLLLLFIKTDKSEVAWASIDEGYLAKRLYEANPDKRHSVGTPIAITVTDQSYVNAFKDLDPQLFAVESAPSADSEKATKEEKKQEKQPTSTATASREAASQASGDRIFASPFARKRAKELNVSLSDMAKGSGLRNRITAADVEKASSGVKKKTTARTPSSATTAIRDRSHVDIPLSEIRKIIARRLSESMSTSPHYYVTVECEMDNLLAMRKEINEGEEAKVSVNDFIIKAAAHAIRDVPDVNVSWLGDKIRKYNYVDISVAVATPSGLITPIVTDADKRALGDISSTVKGLAARAKDNKLLPHEFQGGTLTISNLGMYGVKQFTAIINPPQSCIIAIGGTNSVVKPDGKGGFKNVSTMLCTISSDHRTVDGALAAQYMQAFKKYIENPSKLML